jgi:hypothetical protein
MYRQYMYRQYMYRQYMYRQYMYRQYMYQLIIRKAHNISWESMKETLRVDWRIILKWIKEIGCEDVYWNRLAQDASQL